MSCLDSVRAEVDRIDVALNGDAPDETDALAAIDRAVEGLLMMRGLVSFSLDAPLNFPPRGWIPGDAFGVYGPQRDREVRRG